MQKRVNLCEDRLTNLPSCLITKILSCLPTEDAVATSLLSTRWKRSWMSVTNLNFDNKINYVFDSARDAPTVQKFTNFVTRVLLIREKSSLQSVRLKCYRDNDDSAITAWLAAIIQSGVQELYIGISVIENGNVLRQRLTPDIFRCSTLVVLKLDVRSCVTIPTSSCLPRLKTLHLARVRLTNDASITNLMSGCPVLEELELSGYRGEDLHLVNIFPPVLKKLIIKDLVHGELNQEYQIVIDTPTLEYLTISDNLLQFYKIENVDHLIEAVISCDWDPFEDREIYFSVDAMVNIRQSIKDFLNGISHVQNLVLSCDSIWGISWCNPALPEFSNLTCLKFHTEHDHGWHILAELLENSPCLETLYIQLLVERYHPMQNGPDTLPFRGIPSCFFSHLKEVEIGFIGYYEDWMHLAGYILTNANVLEKLILHHQPNDVAGAEFLKALLFFPRASAICEVVVLES